MSASIVIAGTSGSSTASSTSTSISATINGNDDISSTPIIQCYEISKDMDMQQVASLAASPSSPASPASLGLKYKKMLCRYGRGCTHSNDVIHLKKFWHEKTYTLTTEQLASSHICNECMYADADLKELQLHLKRKTAWNCTSLIGCRVSCLLDYREWHDGFVINYHRSGKHQVEFYQLGERRWLYMKKMAFYIMEHSHQQHHIRGDVISSSSSSSNIDDDTGDYKETDVYSTYNNRSSNDGNQILTHDNEHDWSYVEEISLDYAFTQSMLFKMYGCVVQETGHKTKGHHSLTVDDKEVIAINKGSLLYGELLPRGSNKAFATSRLDAATAKVLFDLGCGTGKICVQAFLQFKNLQYVYGVELSQGRYLIAEEAMLHMVELLKGTMHFDVTVIQGKSISIREMTVDGTMIQPPRVLHIECGSLFDVTNISIADIVMLETDIPVPLLHELCLLLDDMHPNARTLTYMDLRKLWNIDLLPFKQLDINRYISDRYPTSWSVQRGHHFYIWVKIDRSKLPLSSVDDVSDMMSSLSPLSPGRNRKQHNNDANDDGRCFPNLFSYFFRSSSSGSSSNDSYASSNSPNNKSSSRKIVIPVRKSVRDVDDDDDVPIGISFSLDHSIHDVGVSSSSSSSSSNNNNNNNSNSVTTATSPTINSVGEKSSIFIETGLSDGYYDIHNNTSSNNNNISSGSTTTTVTTATGNGFNVLTIDTSLNAMNADAINNSIITPHTSNDVLNGSSSDRKMNEGYEAMNTPCGST